MIINRFEAIVAELDRLAAEIATINSQPFDLWIDLHADARISGNVDEMSRMESTSLRRLNDSLPTRQ